MSEKLYSQPKKRANQLQQQIITQQNKYIFTLIHGDQTEILNDRLINLINELYEIHKNLQESTTNIRDILFSIEKNLYLSVFRNVDYTTNLNLLHDDIEKDFKKDFEEDIKKVSKRLNEIEGMNQKIYDLLKPEITEFLDIYEKYSQLKSQRKHNDDEIETFIQRVNLFIHRYKISTQNHGPSSGDNINVVLKQKYGVFMTKIKQELEQLLDQQRGGKNQFVKSKDNKKYKNKCIYTKPKCKTEYVKYNKQFITLKQFQKLKK